jgi:cytochrome c553
MAGFAAGLSKQDIENVAAYYASLPPALRYGTPAAAVAGK